MKLTNDLRFTRRLNDSCAVAVPVQKMLMAAIPVVSGTPPKKYRAFAHDSVPVVTP